MNQASRNSATQSQSHASCPSTMGEQRVIENFKPLWTDRMLMSRTKLGWRGQLLLWNSAGKCLYIDTEGTFRPERLLAVAERYLWISFFIVMAMRRLLGSDCKATTCLTMLPTPGHTTQTTSKHSLLRWVWLPLFVCLNAKKMIFFPFPVC